MLKRLFRADSGVNPSGPEIGAHPIDRQQHTVRVMQLVFEEISSLSPEEQKAFFENPELTTEFRNQFFIQARRTNNKLALEIYLKFLHEQGWYVGQVAHWYPGAEMSDEALVLPNGLLLPTGQKSRHNGGIQRYLRSIKYGYVTPGIERKVFQDLGGVVIADGLFVQAKEMNSVDMKSRIQTAIDFLLAVADSDKNPYFSEVIISIPNYDVHVSADKLRTVLFSPSLAHQTSKREKPKSLG